MRRSYSFETPASGRPNVDPRPDTAQVRAGTRRSGDDLPPPTAAPWNESPPFRGGPIKRKNSPTNRFLRLSKEGEAGRKVADVCRTHGITEQTYYRWKSKHGGLELSEMQRLKQLEGESPLEADRRGADARHSGNESGHRKSGRPQRRSATGGVAGERAAHKVCDAGVAWWVRFGDMAVPPPLSPGQSRAAGALRPTPRCARGTGIVGCAR